MVPDGLRVSEILERCWRGDGEQRAEEAASHTECTGTRRLFTASLG